MGAHFLHIAPLTMKMFLHQHVFHLFFKKKPTPLYKAAAEISGMNTEKSPLNKTNTFCMVTY